MERELWSSFTAFTSLEQEMHHLLDRMGGRPWMEGLGWRPDTDVFRDEDCFVVQVELPGVDPAADVRVGISDGMLQIVGDRARKSGVTDGDRVISERRYGSFRRAVMLPAGADADRTEACFGNGLLTIRVPIDGDPALSKDVRPIGIEIAESGSPGR